MSGAAGGDPGGLAARKQELRGEFAERLGRIDPDVARRAAQDVADRLLSMPELRTARRVLTCLSFGSELDTWALVDRLQAEGRELFAPRADPRDRTIHVHPYPCELVTLGFGLRQPPRGAPELDEREIDSSIDVALVLGLAFDRRGYRLGHGSGYFDRFLAAHPLFAVGLAFDEQIIDRLPVEPHDRPMDLVVTPAGPARARPDI